MALKPLKVDLLIELTTEKNLTKAFNKKPTRGNLKNLILDDLLCWNWFEKFQDISQECYIRLTRKNIPFG